MASSTPIQRHVYYLTWEARLSSGLLAATGWSEATFYGPLRHAGQVEAAAENVRRDYPQHPDLRVLITNWKLLRIEPDQGGAS